MPMQQYNWIFTTSNDNVYVLGLVIIILVLIILNFGLWKRKNDQFFDISIPSTTPYQAPTESNPALNMTLTDAEKTAISNGISKLDGDQETVINQSTLSGRQNDIINQNSSMYTWGLTSNGSVIDNSYKGFGNYATLDDIGSTLTDTLGGVNSSLGYAILDDQLGTFTPKLRDNEFTYDNTADYNTGLDSNSVDGVSKTMGYGWNGAGTGGVPIYLQKDFTGVANIFAPNIIVANPPLNNQGYPDISFRS